MADIPFLKTERLIQPVSRDIAGESIQPDSFQSLTVCKADYFPHHGFCAAMIPEVRVYSENMHNGNLIILQCGLPVNFMVIIPSKLNQPHGSSWKHGEPFFYKRKRINYIMQILLLIDASISL